MATEKADLSEFAAKVKVSDRRKCFFQRLEPEQQTKMLDAANAGYTASVIAAVVTEWGVPIKEHAVRYHLKGSCSCG
jgi:hypothetical protein